MIDFKCPTCGTAMSVPASLAGASDTCSWCRSAVAIPQPPIRALVQAGQMRTARTPPLMGGNQIRRRRPFMPATIAGKLILVAVLAPVLALGIWRVQYYLADGEKQKNENMAWREAQRFVEAELLCPGSAVFHKDSTIHTPPRQYSFSGHVDSENAFGAPIRKDFYCRVLQLTTVSWRCESVRVGERWIIIDNWGRRTILHD